MAQLTFLRYCTCNRWPNRYSHQLRLQGCQNSHGPPTSTGVTNNDRSCHAREQPATRVRIPGEEDTIRPSLPRTRAEEKKCNSVCPQCCPFSRPHDASLGGDNVLASPKNNQESRSASATATLGPIPHQPSKLDPGTPLNPPKLETPLQKENLPSIRALILQAYIRHLATRPGRPGSLHRPRARRWQAWDLPQ